MTAAGELHRYFNEVVLNHNDDNCLIWPFGSDNHGYGMIWANGKQCRVSRLVCEKRHGPPPASGYEAAHNCGKGHLGCVNSRHITWKTHAENMNDRILHGTLAHGEKIGTAKLTWVQVIKIRSLKGKMMQTQIAAHYGVSKATIHNILHFKTWRPL